MHIKHRSNVMCTIEGLLGRRFYIITEITDNIAAHLL